jgi:hypothetical protein
VPWIIFSTYSGEISDYYFAMNRLISLLVISFLIYKVWEIKLMAVKVLVGFLIMAYSIYNFSLFLEHEDVGLFKRRDEVFKSIEQGKRIEFQIGVPESYLYYYYMRVQKGIEVY